MLQEGFTAGHGVHHWHSIDTLNSGLVAPQAAPATSNLTLGYWYTAILVVRQRVVAAKLWLACNSTTTGGNVELGLYDSAGTKLVSASASHPGAVTELVVDITDTPIDPGWYRFAALATPEAAGIYRLALSVVEAESYGTLYGGGGETALPSTLSYIGATTTHIVGGILINTVVS